LFNAVTIYLIKNPNKVSKEYFHVSEAIMPRFAENIPNVTVTLGKDALLACVVENLRGYKVRMFLSASDQKQIVR